MIKNEGGQISVKNRPIGMWLKKWFYWWNPWVLCIHNMKPLSDWLPSHKTGSCLFKTGVTLVGVNPCRQASSACLILISSISLRCCALFVLCYQFTTAAFRLKCSQYINGFWCFYCLNLLFLFSFLSFRLARSIHSISSCQTVINVHELVHCIILPLTKRSFWSKEFQLSAFIICITPVPWVLLSARCCYISHMLLHSV